MAKRTKVEVDYTTKARGELKVAIIREVYVDSGRVKRIRCKLDALDWASLKAQVVGAMGVINESRKANESKGVV